MRVKALIAAVLMILAFATMAMGGTNLTVEISRDLDVVNALASKTKLEFGLGPLDVKLIWKHEFYKPDDSCKMTLGVGSDWIGLKYSKELLASDAGNLVTTLNFSRTKIEWKKNLNKDEPGDVVVTVDLDSLGIKWEKSLEGGFGKITATYKWKF